MSSVQIAADLLTAANHIETFGHLKRHYGQKGHPCCAGGAIQVAVYGGTVHEFISTPELRSDADRNLRVASAYAELRWHLAINHIPTWNDAPERTQEEVVAALRGTAERVSPGSTDGQVVR